MAIAQQSPHRSFNRRDAFSHSEQCDAVFSLSPGASKRSCGLAPTVVNFDLLAIPQAFTVDLFKHRNCHCWCHTALNLFDPNAEYTLPEEYITSADRAFMTESEEFSAVTVTQDGQCDPFGETDRCYDAEYDADSARGVNGIDAEPVLVRTPAPIIASKTGFSNWSRDELRRGKCFNCNDKLADCECVE